MTKPDRQKELRNLVEEALDIYEKVFPDKSRTEIRDAIVRVSMEREKVLDKDLKV